MTFTSIQGDRLPPFSFRNRLYNGDMRIDQRNAGAACTNPNGSVNYLCDRFYLYSSGNTCSAQRISNWATTPNPWALQFTGKANFTNFIFGQRIEANNIIDAVGQTVTFQVKIAASALTNCNWNAVYPSAADNYTSVTDFANGYFTVNSTPKIYTSSFTVNAACGNGVAIQLLLSSPSSFSSGTLTTGDWQLETGSVATPFERRPMAIELPLCQRYWCKSYAQGTTPGTAVGTQNGAVFNQCTQTAYSSGFLATYVKYPVTMRKAANTTNLITYDNAGTASRVSWYDSSWHDGGANQNLMATVSDSGFSAQIGSISGIVAYSFDWVANAEIY